MRSVTHSRIEQPSTDTERYPGIGSKQTPKRKTCVRKLRRIFLRCAVEPALFFHRESISKKSVIKQETNPPKFILRFEAQPQWDALFFSKFSYNTNVINKIQMT